MCACAHMCEHLPLSLYTHTHTHLVQCQASVCYFYADRRILNRGGMIWLVFLNISLAVGWGLDCRRQTGQQGSHGTSPAARHGWGQQRRQEVHDIQRGDRKDMLDMGMRERTGWEMAPRLSAGAGERRMVLALLRNGVARWARSMHRCWDNTAWV